ncbi:MAG: hypothetical protein FWF18_04325 [Dehalococcoidia bacterium]|nr:hypothetical protein [Dehalococcoidia bacterium]
MLLFYHDASCISSNTHDKLRIISFQASVSAPFAQREIQGDFFTPPRTSPSWRERSDRRIWWRGVTIHRPARCFVTRKLVPPARIYAGTPAKRD